jgi:hypothetical protein
MDAQSQQVTELKAELERLLLKAAKNENTLLSALEKATLELQRLQTENIQLKETIAALDDHGRASSFVETLRAKDAEIERLTRELKEERETFLLRRLHDTELIPELVEWCSYDPESLTEHGKAILQRAMEARD